MSYFDEISFFYALFWQLGTKQDHGILWKCLVSMLTISKFIIKLSISEILCEYLIMNIIFNVDAIYDLIVLEFYSVISHKFVEGGS